jgi:hypothetical protein
VSGSLDVHGVCPVPPWGHRAPARPSGTEHTLKALAAYSEPGALLPADGGDCEDVLARFARAGIDIDALAVQLQEEGA